MYMRLFRKMYGVSPNGMMHVGAHQAEEYKEYEINNMWGNGQCYWVEVLPSRIEELRAFFADKPEHSVIQALAWGTSNVRMKLKVTNHTASSSVFELGEHANFYKDIHVVETMEVTSSRLDELLKETDFFDFLVLDVQGAELEVLIGLGDLINNVNWIFLEISKRKLYLGGVLENEIDSYLGMKGFRRRFVEWDRNAGWGDALYIRQEFWKIDLKHILLRTFWWIYRRFYGRIPQPIFPYLICFKRTLKQCFHK